MDTKRILRSSFVTFDSNSLPIKSGCSQSMFPSSRSSKEKKNGTGTNSAQSPAHRYNPPMAHLPGLIATLAVSLASGFTAIYGSRAVIAGLRRGRYHLGSSSNRHHQRRISLDRHPLIFIGLTLLYLGFVALFATIAAFALYG